MGRYFSLALQLPLAERKTKKSKKIIMMPRINFGLMILALLIIFSVLYLWEVSDISTKGYEIRTLERELGQAQEQKQRLELEAAALKSAQNLEADAKAWNLVPSAGVNYVRDEGYALKQ